MHYGCEDRANGVIDSIIGQSEKHETIRYDGRNDVISLRELSYCDNEYKIVWDNDSLACLTAVELKMDLILLLTDANGLYKDYKSSKSFASKKRDKYDSGVNYQDTEEDIIDVYRCKRLNYVLMIFQSSRLFFNFKFLQAFRLIHNFCQNATSRSIVILLLTKWQP